jgi:hypothetical protein
MPQIQQKAFEGRRLPFQFDGHSRRIVQDKTAQAVFDGQPVNKWPEADSLHDACYRDMTPLAHGIPEPPGSRISAKGIGSI